MSILLIVLGTGIVMMQIRLLQCGGQYEQISDRALGRGAVTNGW